MICLYRAQAAVARGCGRYLCGGGGGGGRAWARAFDLAIATISIALILVEIEGLSGPHPELGRPGHRQRAQ